jgi:hypothetical protein
MLYIVAQELVCYTVKLMTNSRKGFKLAGYSHH